jgi:phage tail P2-like protein
MALPDNILASTLLPPNAQSPEMALEAAMRADIDIAEVGNLWNPDTCPAELLPFLAWGLAIARWDPEWTEAQRRAAIWDAIPFHRRKGTRAIVREVLDRFSPLLEIVEWFEANPPQAPHTFEVRMPANLIPASFLSAETAAAIIRDVASVKPARAHFTFVQYLEAQAIAWLSGGAMTATALRLDLAAEHDPDPRWDNYVQTEDGEPILAESGAFLELE